MAKKEVKLGRFNTITVKLAPAKFKKFRYGLGFSHGISNFEIYNIKRVTNVPDTTKLILTPLAINASVFYRLAKHFDLQAILTEGLNVTVLSIDSANLTGSGASQTKTAILNRISFAILSNYNFNISKSQNNSAFIGLGPLYQHLGFFKSNTIGLRFNAGININNYGLTTRLFAASDIAYGEFSDNVSYVNGFTYKYFSGRIGLTFIF